VTAAVALAVLGLVTVCVVAARRPSSGIRPSRDPSVRALTSTFVRGVVGTAEPLRAGATSVRAVRSSDADAIEATIDDVVIGVMGWPVDMAARYRTAVRRRRAPTLMVITERDREVAIGVVALEPLPVTDSEPFHRTVRIGLWMGPQGRGKGHMGRAVRLLVELMIGNDISLLAETAPTNHAARHVLERAGMVETARRVVRLPDGSEVDGIVYERFAPRFARRPTDHQP
jgi:RimJ/RimL family protein N-acetyltransferase